METPMTLIISETGLNKYTCTHRVKDTSAPGSGQSGLSHLVPGVHAERQSAPHLGDGLACNCCRTPDRPPTCSSRLSLSSCHLRGRETKCKKERNPPRDG
ncbi:unnamed protein product [Pleuronectes platessa]|uniref:Uncharacterized protein n=1 Tax=Pleuronectes platessa TaxID=8262 RepID=A0A9N7ZD81_PLEPL|nr:unnamed protein product [Pleuronectes platessa]